MKVNAPPFRVSLRWGRPLTLSDGKGTCITARRGAVWITQDNDDFDPKQQPPFGDPDWKQKFLDLWEVST